MRKQSLTNRLFKFFGKNKFNQSILIAIVVFLIVLIIANSIIKNNNENYNNIKINKSKYLVYDKYNNNEDKFIKKVPQININSTSVEAINKDINLFIADFINIDECIINYEYNINGIILSVVVKIIDYESEETGPKAYFRTYNINLDTTSAISDESLLQFYGIQSEQEIAEPIKNKFQEHYTKEAKEGFIEANLCNFDCYIENRGFTSYLENVSYYVKEAKLYAFKPFNFYSIYGEQEYFKESDFMFLIKEAPSEQ